MIVLGVITLTCNINGNYIAGLVQDCGISIAVLCQAINMYMQING